MLRAISCQSYETPLSDGQDDNLRRSCLSNPIFYFFRMRALQTSWTPPNPRIGLAFPNSVTRVLVLHLEFLPLHWLYPNPTPFLSAHSNGFALGSLIRKLNFRGRVHPKAPLPVMLSDFSRSQRPLLSLRGFCACGLELHFGLSFLDSWAHWTNSLLSYRIVCFDNPMTNGNLLALCLLASAYEPLSPGLQFALQIEFPGKEVEYDG